MAYLKYRRLENSPPCAKRLLKAHDFWKQNFNIPAGAKHSKMPYEKIMLAKKMVLEGRGDEITSLEGHTSQRLFMYLLRWVLKVWHIWFGGGGGAEGPDPPQ